MGFKILQRNRRIMSTFPLPIIVILIEEFANLNNDHKRLSNRIIAWSFSERRLKVE